MQDFLDENKDPAIELDLKRNSKKAHIPPKVFEFCCKTFLSSAIDEKYTVGFTNFNYQSSDNDDYKLCTIASWHTCLSKAVNKLWGDGRTTNYGYLP